MKQILSLLLMLCCATAALAHGDKKHVMGTIEKVSPDSVVVKVKDGTSVMVKLVSSTVFIKHSSTSDTPAKVSDLATGDRVVIHATPKEGGLEANEVKFSPPSAKATGTK
jgi:Domain of unknown function (DUF5666)